MSHELLDTLRNANREFQEFIDRAAQEGTRVLKSPGGLHYLEKVNLQLKQVSTHLSARSGFSPEEPEGAYEVKKYVEKLRSLRTVIQTLHFSLLTEKSRVDNARANLQSACAWANSVREIS